MQEVVATRKISIITFVRLKKETTRERLRQGKVRKKNLTGGGANGAVVANGGATYSPRGTPQNSGGIGVRSLFSAENLQYL